MKKMLMVTALLCALAVCVSACGTREPGSIININEKPAEAVTLSMFVPIEMDIGSTDSFRDFTLAYNALNSNVRITVDSASTADGFDRFLEQRLDAEGAVDIFIVNAENVKYIAYKDQFCDLSGLDGFKKLTESAAEQAMVGDIAYTVPLKMAVYIMDVNVSMLERHGLEVPGNYDEFLNCCKVLKEQGVTPIALNRWWAMAVPVMARSLYPVYQAENRDEIIEGLNSGKLKIGDYMIDGFRMFEYFLDEGYYGEDLIMDEVDSIKADTKDRDDFYNSRVAFRFCHIDKLSVTETANDDVCMPVGIPMLPDGVITLPSISVRLSVNANSSYLDESVAFVDYVASQRVKLLEQDKSGNLSPFKNMAVTETEASWQRSVLDQLNAGHQIPLEDMNLHFGYWDNTRRLCLEMIGGMTAEEAAREYNRIQMEEIQAYEDNNQL